MNLYIAIVKDKEIARIDFEWMEELQTIEIVRDLIKKQYSPGWNGVVLIDNQPIDLKATSHMFEAEAFYENNGGVDFRVVRLAWKYPGLSSS
jgi:hypothetical protein